MADGGGVLQSQAAPKLHSSFEINAKQEEEENDSPVEQVRLTVPITDNPNLPALTFRTWVLGLLSCVILAFLNSFFGYRQNSLSVGSITAQIVTLPLGKAMAAALPTKMVRFPFTRWEFSLNPGPFNMKEHVLITIFSTCGAKGVYALSIVNIVIAFYHRKMNFFAAFLLAQTTSLLGYGWGGLFRKILVDSPYMWWPETMVQVSLFRTLHEEEKRPKRGLTRLQFFLMVFVASFGYYIFPGYFFPSLSIISIGCLIWKNSVTAQQLTSGQYGLGLGSFTLDWNSVVAFTGNPIASPFFAIFNTFVGFFLFTYILIPAFYWSNAYDARKFPFISPATFDSSGKHYNVTQILNEKTFDLDKAAYDGYSKLYMSLFFAFDYGLSFATLTASISHVLLFNGKSIWALLSKAKTGLKRKYGDVHTRIMKKNYATVPGWWFYIILVIMFGLSIFTIEGFGQQLQLPWWGLILACAISLIFILPIGVIQATTNQQVGLNVITELVIGYLYPGKPVANVTFKTYGYISMSQALNFVQDFKLGHYMKIAPKLMFAVQLVGTMVSVTVQFITTWMLLTNVDYICDVSKLPKGSPWTCPGDEVFYSASIIWGVIGPKRMFTKEGIYPELNWFFLIGLLAPVPIWLLSRKYPAKKWIELINMPVLLSGASSIPPARTVNMWMWVAVGTYFNFYIYRNHKAWWAKYAYILAAALTAGVAFMGTLLYFAIQSRIDGPEWWGLENNDHCHLARCPTAPGIEIEGCPVF